MEETNSTTTDLIKDVKENYDGHWLKRLFLSPDIRIVGTTKDPLFVAMDVAKLMGDKKLIKKARNWKDRYINRDVYRDKNGKIIDLFFTERGLYHYMLSLNTPEADDFMHYSAGLIADHLNEKLSKINEQISQT